MPRQAVLGPAVALVDEAEATAMTGTAFLGNMNAQFLIVKLQVALLTLRRRWRRAVGAHPDESLNWGIEVD